MRTAILIAIVFWSILYNGCRNTNAAAPIFRKTAVSEPVEPISGAALYGNRDLYTWGHQLRHWPYPFLKSAVLTTGDFAEGGCIVDLDLDGKPEFVSKRNQGLSDLVWLSPPNWKPEVIDTQVDTHDCLEANLFGRRGVLVIHRNMQVRFYQRPSAPAQRWLSEEIYSIYTPSQQAGLMLEDVDHDGYPDIYCGNYWIKSPNKFDLPWRLFAINTYSEQPLSAMLSLTKTGPDLIVSQGHLDPGRLTWFERPSDPKQMWKDHRLSDSLVRPHGLAILDNKKTDRPDVIVGERNGKESRLIMFHNEGNYLFKQSSFAAGDDVISLWPSQDGILVVSRREVSLWR